MKRSLILITSLIALTPALQAAQNGPAADLPPAPPGYYRPLPDYQRNNPAQLLEDGIARLQMFVAQKGLKDPQVLTAFLNEQIAPFFDFDRMARLVGGRFYEQLDETDKARFRRRLSAMFFSALGRNLGAYVDPQPRIDFLPPRRRGQNEVEVAARVLPWRGYPVRLVFRFARTPDGWKIYDASYNGQSAVLYYRRYVMQQIRRYGPQVLLD